MNRYLLNLVVSVALVFVSLSAFSQVKVADSGASKFYDNGTRITYFDMQEFPNSSEMREYVTKKVTEHPDVNRVTIYTNGTLFMYEALQSVDPYMIVDMVNDALDEYVAEFGEIPEIEKSKMSDSNSAAAGDRGGDAPANGEVMRKKANTANRPVEVVKDRTNVNTK